MLGFIFCIHARGMLPAHLTSCIYIPQWSILPESNRPWKIDMSGCHRHWLIYVKEWCQIKLISVQYLQCSVFIGACAVIDSELVIPCDVNRGCELWSSARGCWSIPNQSCVAANGSAGSGWVMFPGYGAFGAWLAQPGLSPLWIQISVTVMPMLPLDAQAFNACTTCAVVYLTLPVIHCESLARAHFSLWAFKDCDLLRTKTSSTLI